MALNRRTKVISGFSAVVALVAIGGVSYAAIPDSDDGEIHGCRGPVGNLRVIDAENGGHCQSSETELVWNQQGAQGPSGPLAGYEVIQTSENPGAYPWGRQVDCAPGKSVISVHTMIMRTADLAIASPTQATITGQDHSGVHLDVTVDPFPDSHPEQVQWTVVCAEVN